MHQFCVGKSLITQFITESPVIIVVMCRSLFLRLDKYVVFYDFIFETPSKACVKQDVSVWLAL